MQSYSRGYPTPREYVAGGDATYLIQLHYYYRLSFTQTVARLIPHYPFFAMASNVNFELLQTVALFHYYEESIRLLEDLRASQQAELEECHNEIARLTDQNTAIQNRHWELINYIAELQETVHQLLQARPL